MKSFEKKKTLLKYIDCNAKLKERKRKLNFYVKQRVIKYQGFHSNKTMVICSFQMWMLHKKR